jgi:hypothetical protein
LSLITVSTVACPRVIMDSPMRMQYSPISLLRKSVRGDMVPSERITDLAAKPQRATQIVPLGLWQNSPAMHLLAWQRGELSC